MSWSGLRVRFSRLDLQVKVILVLVLVIGPTFLLVNLLVSQIALPVIEEELRVLGNHAARVLSEDVATERLLTPGKEALLDRKLRETFYLQPSVIQVDAFRKGESGEIELAASTEEPAQAVRPREEALPERPFSRRLSFADGLPYWEIWFPVLVHKRVAGAVRLEVSLQNARSFERSMRKITWLGGLATILILLLALSYFLRKTILNDRLLRRSESRNLELLHQLHEAERQLMINEKLAAMGQLTAQLAHEIGTPLNAVGGHLELLKSDVREAGGSGPWLQRIAVIHEQVGKIARIVEGFLHSTAQPASQPQLLDANQLVEKALAIVSPRIDSLGAQLQRQLDRNLGPIRAAPLDIEQVLLNLLNNSLDSLQARRRAHQDSEMRLEVFSRKRSDGSREWVEIGVSDTGEGIRRADLHRVFEPFFTTKAIGVGTGLGLSICQDIAGKYHGRIELDSREGGPTRATLFLPYGAAP